MTNRNATTTALTSWSTSEPASAIFVQNKMAGEIRSLEHPTLKVLIYILIRETVRSVCNPVSTKYSHHLGSVRAAEQEISRGSKVP